MAGTRRRYKYNSKKYKTWRLRIYKRDRYSCQLCFQRGAELNAHHILRKFDYPGKAYDIDNGITLCVKCHDAVTEYEPAFAELFSQIVKKTLTESFVVAFFRQLIENYPEPVKKLKAAKKWKEIPERMVDIIRKQETSIKKSRTRRKTVETKTKSK